MLCEHYHLEEGEVVTRLPWVNLRKDHSYKSTTNMCLAVCCNKYTQIIHCSLLTICNNYTHSIHYSNNHLPHEIVWCFQYVRESWSFNPIDADTWSVFAICMHLVYHRIWFGICADILTCSDICVGSASDESCCELRCAVWIARPRELK